jgi:hypothetical protein
MNNKLQIKSSLVMFDGQIRKKFIFIFLIFDIYEN